MNKSIYAGYNRRFKGKTATIYNRTIGGKKITEGKATLIRCIGVSVSDEMSRWVVQFPRDGEPEVERWIFDCDIEGNEK